MTRGLVCALALLSLSACFHIRYVNQETTSTTPAYEKWNNTYVFGLVEGSQPHNVSAACPAGYAEVRDVQSFVNGLLQTITIGIYDPTEVTVFCAPKSGAAEGGEVPLALAR
jgi:hypothetical protein